MAVGVGEAVGAAMADVAVDPPLPEPRLLDRGDAPLERLRAPRPQGDMADDPPAAPPSARGCSGGSRPSRAGRRTAPRAPPPPCRARRRRSEGSPPASASAARRGAMRATSCIGSVTPRPAPAGRRGRRTAPPAWSFARFSRSRSARSRAAASTSATRSCGRTTTPSASSTTASPWLIVAPPTVTGSPISPGVVFAAPLTRT